MRLPQVRLAEPPVEVRFTLLTADTLSTVRLPLCVTVALLPPLADRTLSEAVWLESTRQVPSTAVTALVTVSSGCAPEPMAQCAVRVRLLPLTVLPPQSLRLPVVEVSVTGPLPSTVPSWTVLLLVTTMAEPGGRRQAQTVAGGVADRNAAVSGAQRSTARASVLTLLTQLPPCSPTWVAQTLLPWLQGLVMEAPAMMQAEVPL